MLRKAVEIPEDAPAWLVEVLKGGANLDSVLLGTVKAMLFTMRVLISSHPDPAALRREWHARKHPELDATIDSLFAGEDDPGHKTYLQALASLEQTIDGRSGLPD